MKTEFQARLATGHQVSGPWTTDLKFILENYLRNGNTLWRRETETPEEAAVRRMTFLDKWKLDRKDHSRSEEGETMSAFADRLSPPPAVTDCQVDWESLKPIKEVPVWQSASGVNCHWFAGVSYREWSNYIQAEALSQLLNGRIAIGHTRESALRNLAEFQSIQK